MISGLAAEDVKMIASLSSHIGEELSYGGKPVRLIQHGGEVVVEIIQEVNIIHTLIVHLLYHTVYEIEGNNFTGAILYSMDLQGGGGLINMGLTCYGNAVIQNLRHLSKLVWIMEDGKYNTLFKKVSFNFIHGMV